MASDHYVLDTEVLVVASMGDQALCLDAVALLHAIRERHLIALDNEGEIMREYSRYMRPATLVAQWWSQMVTRRKISYYSSRLTRLHAAKLRDVSFHASDCKFVGVACRTPSKLLVAEESGYWQAAVVQCLQDDIRLNVLRIKDALSRA